MDSSWEKVGRATCTRCGRVRVLYIRPYQVATVCSECAKIMETGCGLNCFPPTHHLKCPNRQSKPA